MPNWCVGTFKIRGSKENILNFLKNELEGVSVYGESLGQPKIEFNEDYEEFKISSGHKNVESPYYWIKGTHRNFIEDFTGGYLWETENDNERSFTCDNFKAAWNINVNPYVELSEKYNLDFRIYGFERGMCFNREIEILKGKLTIDRTITFTDYNWECPFPDLGGWWILKMKKYIIIYKDIFTQFENTKIYDDFKEARSKCCELEDELEEKTGEYIPLQIVTFNGE